MHLCFVARLTKNRSSVADRTGAKHSVLFQGCGSRFPRTQIWYLALVGNPFLSHLMVLMAMVGSVGPSVGRS